MGETTFFSSRRIKLTYFDEKAKGWNRNSKHVSTRLVMSLSLHRSEKFHDTNEYKSSDNTIVKKVVVASLLHDDGDGGILYYSHGC